LVVLITVNEPETGVVVSITKTTLQTHHYTKSVKTTPIPVIFQ